MGKNNQVILTTFLVFLIITDVSDAAFFLNFRKLAASSPSGDPNGSPIPSPVGGKEKMNHTSPPSTSGEEKVKDKQVTNITKPPATPPTDFEKDNDTIKEGGKEHNIPPKEKVKEHDNTPKEEEVKEKEQEKGEKKPEVAVGGNESCDGIERRCMDEKSMVACIKSFNDVSKALVLLITNKGDNSLKVDLTISSSGNKQDAIEIPRLQTKQVNISPANVGGNEIKLSAGNGYCVLHLDLDTPTLQGNYFRWFPSYSKFMTPIYGAYLMLLTTLIAGGVFACCWFRKRRKHSDVPYQELEMSMPESAAVADTGEGWDEVWDDDWDEEKAVKSPGHSISANGLTSRTPKKDGWEDWDD